jgi:molecular chaperone HtpG
VSAFEIDLAGLLQVFGGHLYSDPRVFVRELVQNAADAIVLRRVAEPEHRGAIVVRAEPGAVVFEDDGAGLDREAIGSALGKIGYSTKRGGAPAGTAGRFGIGLLSGFLVAQQIELTTRAAGSEALRWIGRVDGTWSIEPASREAVGTSVRLALDPAHAALGRVDELRAMLLRFARYIPISLVLDGPDGRETIDEPPPWAAGDPLAAARSLAGAEPLAAIRVSDRDLRGVLWIHRDTASTEGGRIALYQHGLVIEHAARDLLPTWAGFVTGAVESTTISPTASRETYVRDDAAAATADALREHVLGWLARLPEAVDVFDRVLALHATHLRGACASAPELLDAIGDRIPMETSHGDVDLPTLRAVSGDRAFRVADTPQAFAHVAPLAIAQGLPVVNAIYLHDRPFVEAWARRRGVALEPLDVASLDVLLRPAPDEAARFARVIDRARGLLEPLDVEPEIGRFDPTSIPAFLVSEPTAIRERARAVVRGSTSSLSRALLKSLPVADTSRGTRFVLNVDNTLVAGLPDVADVDVAARVVRLLYAQSVMLIRRTVSRGEARVFSDDLAGLLTRIVGGGGGDSGDMN